MLQPGQHLENYEILNSLGEGGFGCVWLARDMTVRGRKVAIKELTNPTPESMDRFLQEMEILAGINHPGIVTFHHALDGGRFLVMEYIPEGSLRIQMRIQRTYAPDVAARIIASLCGVLENVHARQVVHHDLKPDNVFLQDDRIRVGDFGIAEIKCPGQNARPIGTLPYMAPECFSKKYGPYDHRSDLFSIGVIMVELLTGSRPFQASDQEKLIYKICFDPAPVPLTVPKWMQGVLQKALAKSTELRFQTAAEMRHAIESRSTPQIFPAALIKANRANVNAERLLARRKVGAAITQAEQGLRIYPEHPRLLFTMARSMLIMRRAEKALPLLLRSRQLDPGIQCERELGYTYIQLRQHGNAIGCLTEHARRRPDDLKGFALLMEALYHAGEYQQVVEIAGALRDEDPLFINNGFLAEILDLRIKEIVDEFKKAAKQIKRVPHYFVYNLQVLEHVETLGYDRIGDALYFAPYPATLVSGASSRATIPPLRIEVETPGAKTRSLEFDSGFVSVGRSSGVDIEISEDPNVSRYHAIFYYRDVLYHYRDLNSTQGSYLGNQTVGLDVPLVGMQAIRIGSTVLRISY